MSDIKPRLSVVILCYKAEEQAINFATQMITKLQSLSILYELIMVANYNKGEAVSDKTPELVKLFAKDSKVPIIVVAVEKRGMMGWDMKSGLDVATGDAVAIIDGDGQMPADDVVRVYGKLTEGDFDMAQTYRVVRFDGAKRIFISKVFNFIVKIFFPSVKVHDVNSKPKVLKRETLQKIKLEAHGWFIDAEMVIQVSRLGLKVGEVPTEFHTNKLRPSFIRFKAILEFIWNLVEYRLKLWGIRG